MLKSVSSELCWPALIDPRAASVYGLLSQIQKSQWLAPARLRRLQAMQLSARLLHARQHSGFFAPRLAGKDLSPEAAHATLQTLPLLTRSDLQSHADALFCTTPVNHGKITTNLTSGSTGQPVSVQCTLQAFTLRAAANLRGHLWHRVPLEKSFAAIRGGIHGRGVTGEDALPSWGGVTAMLFETGPSFALNITTPLAEQKKWLLQHRPVTLLTLPSNLRGLSRILDGPWPELEHVLTISETLSADVRDLVRETWKRPIHDKYSSEELGPIAIECEHGRYHCNEHLIVEVLRDDGTACLPGEIGRLVVTDLYNFATALIRYEIRDYAEVGGTCPCGRGLPVLNRIMGRVRNIMTLPDGRRFWPLFGLREYHELAPVSQFQFVQTALDQLLVRLVSDRPLLTEETQAIVARIHASVGYPLQVSFERVEGSLIEGDSMKFEEFRSLVEIELPAT